MGKKGKKLKKSQMYQKFVAFETGVTNLYTNNTQINTSCLVPTSGSFQTPHSDQDSLTELLDDNSPHVGGGTLGVPNVLGMNNYPSGLTQPSTSEIVPRPVDQVGKWTALKPVEVASKTKVRQDFEDIFPDRPTTSVVEGPASKIQLVIDKSKKLNIHTAPLPSKTVEADASTIYIRTNKSDAWKPLNAAQPAKQDIGVGASNMTAENTDKARPVWAPNKPQPDLNWWPKRIHSGIPNSGLGWPRSMAKPSASLPHQASSQSEPQASVHQVYETEQIVELPVDFPQAYSPSDVYAEGAYDDKAVDVDLESLDAQAGDKRVSAFHRLGPAQPAVKKPKLTINLLCNEDEDKRQVLDETDECPTHLRPELTASEDPIVVKYLDMWPWMKTRIVPARIATVRASKSAMILEQEYLEAAYMREHKFIQISATGYPPSFTKEDVLDAILDSVKGNSLIPCFIEFSKAQCKFLVLRSRSALLAIHKYGFVINLDKVRIVLTIANIHLNLSQLDFVPRLVLRKIMSNNLEGTSLDLSEFTAKPDISHFIYFPLRRICCQTELMQLQSTVSWETLTHLNLSRNKITTLTGLNLFHSTPRLRHLDLGYNLIERVTMLMQIRNLPLRSLVLEGNPLCTDYTEHEHYIRVLTMLFSGLQEIDGVQIKSNSGLPNAKKNYCCEEAKPIVEKLLEVMFPLLDASPEQRFLIEDLYSEDAVLTITFMYKLHYSAVYKEYRSLFTRARVLDECDMDAVEGSSVIAKLINRWPNLMHDPTTFTVDVLHQSDTTTILKIGGIAKITAETLAENEYLLAFTRTLVLHSKDGVQYKITNEMLYWDLPVHEYADTAFTMTRIRPKSLNLRLDAPPDEELRNKLLEIFMQITELEKKPSERCLEARGWHIRNALEYFSTMLKLDDLDPIMKENDNFTTNV